MIQRAFKDLDVKQIYASYKCENTQSKRVLEKLGFKYYAQLENKNYLGETFSEIAMILEK